MEHLMSENIVSCVYVCVCVCLCVSVGLENIYQLTLNRPSELLVQMEDFEGNKAFARYSSFFIDAECDGYKLTVSGFFNGGAGDVSTLSKDRHCKLA